MSTRTGRSACPAIRRMQPRALLALLVAAALGPTPARAEEGGISAPRSERAERLLVPFEIGADVWAFVEERHLKSPDALRAIDPLFTASRHEEDFTDVYFDSPALDLLARQAAVRHRTRLDPADPDDRSEREQMQIELRDSSSSALGAGQTEFEIKHLTGPAADGREGLLKPWDRDESHPMLGIVRRSHRDDFKKRLADLGLEPRSMRPVLTVRDQRRRIDVLRGGTPFLSISMDFVSSSLWWAQTRFVALEPELDGTAFADADAETRRSMESALGKIVGEIRARFPELQSDPAPTYARSFAELERQLPFLRMLVRTNAHDSDGLFLFAITGLGVLTAASFATLRLVRRRGQRGGRGEHRREAPTHPPAHGPR